MTDRTMINGTMYVDTKGGTATIEAPLAALDQIEAYLVKGGAKWSDDLECWELPERMDVVPSFYNEGENVVKLAIATE